jgi:hypothetical protein
MDTRNILNWTVSQLSRKARARRSDRNAAPQADRHSGCLDFVFGLRPQPTASRTQIQNPSAFTDVLFYWKNRDDTLF